jgi:excisionase family DNA binding protein
MVTTKFIFHKELIMEKPLTTGEIARICQVSQATVLNWIRDRGLNAFATPGGHYRIFPSELREFAARYQMPIDLPPANGNHEHNR